MYYIPLSALKKDVGKVEMVSMKSFNSGIYKMSVRRSEKTDIKLVGLSTNFQIRTRISEGGLLSSVEVGDSVTIYTRHWYQYPLTLGSFNSIYQIEEGSEIYYELNWIKASNLSIVFVCTIIDVVMIIFLLLEIQTENLKKKGYYVKRK
jgi:hypothetical protein